MANIVWANGAGTWSTTTLWSYWDNATESVQAYGQIPQQGDTVYLNGFAVTVGSNYILNIGNGTIRNDTNPYTQIEGGYLSFGTTNIVIANFYVGNTYIGYQGANGTYTMNLTGNIHLTNAVFFRKAGNNSLTLKVNGNITGTNSIATGNTGSLDVIGDVNITNGNNGSLTNEVSVTGELNITTNNWSASSASIIGTLTAKNNYKLSVSGTLTINGNIYYQSSNGSLGVTYNSLVISNPDTFTWKDISETRLNPFIIITDWDLNNQIQYPPENRVVAGTPYAYNEKVGTFAVDYPQESVVLKDVTYDSGNKTGKLVVLPSELINRLLNCPTIETMQQLLIAHLNPETD